MSGGGGDDTGRLAEAWGRGFLAGILATLLLLAAVLMMCGRL